MKYTLLPSRTPSAIPHLALAILARRTSQPWQKAQQLYHHAGNNTNKLSSQKPVSAAAYASQCRKPSTLAPKLPQSSSQAYKPSSRRNVDGASEPNSPRRVRGMVAATSLFGACLGLYVSYLYFSYSRAISDSSHLDLHQNADVSSRWNDLSRDYDDEVDLSEKLMFMKQRRRKLVNQAYGNVLEVSVGTGRNMDLYDLRPYDPRENASSGRSRNSIIRSMTFNDQSKFMVGQAEKKFEDMQTKAKPAEQFQGPVNFVVGDAGIKGVISRPEGGYDTIVQTMGVCSMVDAVGFLRRLGQLCRQPGEKSRWDKEKENQDEQGGQILLLEHGQGHYHWLNQFLDNTAKMHANHYGCWWNKDIERIIKESGLVVERLKRYHLGTTWEIVLRPAKKTEP